MEINWENLINEAKRGMDFAYAPYSHYKVGAAVLAGSGKTYTGCNIENASFPLSMCAERVALFKAISEGEKELLALAVVANSSTISVPCGGCRQVIVEFAPEIPIALCNIEGKRKIVKARDLLPFPFTKDYLEGSEI
ncbi:MAG: cytidine deaminase [Caldiserica bacterium]|jgi:cytidine deaminase|nr:cytidine deaminase [Caldisericota bacterium]MDH7561919.1 cytidine deaminase [Caldisericota bacterium]